jgi:hypothetical protein
MPDASLSSITYDPQGVLDLTFTRPGEGIHDRGRRVGRTQTLDGGVVMTDGGSVAGDRTYILRARLTRAEAEILKHIYETYREIFCSTHDGFYRVAPEQLTWEGSLAVLRLLVISKEEV